MKTAKMPTTDKWIKKMCYLCTMEFYLATKKDEMMELENVILCEVRQTQKAKSLIFSLMWNTNLIQMLRYYETLVTLRGGHVQEG
jgi:hypothetical protein